MADERVVQARCLHCKLLRLYRPRGARLTLFSTGLMILNFFCIECRQYNSQRIVSVKLAEGMSDAGVPTVVVKVPAEMTEHPGPQVARIGAGDVATFENASLIYFNEAAKRELGGISA